MANGTFGGGNGSTTAPYLVEDSADFDAVRNRLNAHYRQTQDIDFENGIFSPIPTFTGSYEGNGFKIKNIKITLSVKNGTTNNSYTGLFSILSAPAIVQNIHIENGDINISTTTSSYNYLGGIVGGLIGAFTVAPVSNCSFQGSVVFSNSAGYHGNVSGIVGYNSSASWVLKNCTVNAKVQSLSTHMLASGIATNIACTNCHFTGEISANNQTSGICSMNCIDCSVTDSTITSLSGNSNGITSLAATRCSVINSSIVSTLSNCSGVSGSTTISCSIINSFVTSNSPSSSNYASGISILTQGSVRGCLSKNTIVKGPNASGIIYASSNNSSNVSNVSDTAVIGGSVEATHAEGYSGGILASALTSGGSHIISKCYCSANVITIGGNLGGIVSIGSNTPNVTNSFFLGVFIKGLGAKTQNVGLISNKPSSSVSNNYALDTAQIILE